MGYKQKLLLPRQNDAIGIAIVGQFAIKATCWRNYQSVGTSVSDYMIISFCFAYRKWDRLRGRGLMPTSHLQTWPSIQEAFPTDTGRWETEADGGDDRREGSEKSEWVGVEGGEIWRQQALPAWAGWLKLSDNLIMTSPHCNGWNRPADGQGGADRSSTEIAPRAGWISCVPAAPAQRKRNMI